jgi:hypothetical protein
MKPAPPVTRTGAVGFFDLEGKKSSFSGKKDVRLDDGFSDGPKGRLLSSLIGRERPKI